MAFGFLQRGSLAEHARQLQLSSCFPSIQLEGLVRGVDNIRYDVSFTSRFVEVTRQHVFRLIAKYGQIELLAEDSGSIPRPSARLIYPPKLGPAQKPAEPADFKRVLLDLHVAALNRAKAENNISIDLL